MSFKTLAKEHFDSFMSRSNHAGQEWLIAEAAILGIQEHTEELHAQDYEAINLAGYHEALKISHQLDGLASLGDELILSLRQLDDALAARAPHPISGLIEKLNEITDQIKANQAKRQLK